MSCKTSYCLLVSFSNLYCRTVRIPKCHHLTASSGKTSICCIHCLSIDSFPQSITCIIKQIETHLTHIKAMLTLTKAACSFECNESLSRVTFQCTLVYIQLSPCTWPLNSFDLRCECVAQILQSQVVKCAFLLNAYYLLSADT